MIPRDSGYHWIFFYLNMKIMGILFQFQNNYIVVNTVMSFLYFLFALIAYGKANSKSDVGTAVFLTKFIDKKDLSGALIESKVPSLKSNVSSYAGFFTVDKNFDSNLFTWFFPSENEAEKSPLVLWLQGGPGTSTLNGIFGENGPFYIKPKRGFGSRDHYWSMNLNMLYIDSPVGSGFSFTKHPSGYAKDLKSVTDNLNNALSQFFTLFPNYQKNDFYIVGQGYGAKFAVSLASNINSKVNLKGIAIGNPFIDPESIVNSYSTFFINSGLIDDDDVTKINLISKQTEIIKSIKQKDYEKAYKLYDDLMIGNNKQSLFKVLTSYDFDLNILHDKDYRPYGDLEKALDEKSVIRKSIHVGNSSFSSGSVVSENLKKEIMQSLKPTLDKLVNKYRVLIYSGQFCASVPHIAVNGLGKVKAKKAWRVNGALAGYCRTTGKLTELMIRNAGMLVSFDQPAWALDMITKFAYNKFSECS